MKINLLIICTGKYIQFLPQFIDSAERYFLAEHNVKYCVFTDKVEEVNQHFLGLDNLHVFGVEHKPWPHATLKRFHFFLQHKKSMPDADYLFYCDVDSRFVAPIGEEILDDLVAVQHCGFVGERGTYETNPKSTAYIAPNEGEMYFGGGFLGGREREFWRACHWIADKINIDERNDVLAVHNDESHWNKYLVDWPPTMILSPSYHYPEEHPHIYGKWAKLGISFEPKILLLNKDHKEVRA